MDHATNWQLYLSFVDSAGRELYNIVNAQSLISDVQALTESFLKHGADANAMLEIRYPVPASEYIVIKGFNTPQGQVRTLPTIL